MNARKLKTTLAKVITAITIIIGQALADGGLEGIKSVFDTFKGQLLTIVPPIAVVALILLGVGYATKMVEKDTFYRWGIGLVIAGSAAKITDMMFVAV